MEQATARALLSEGGVLVIHDMPVGSEFGIDFNSWTIGPKFRGVKMIPPGVHFVCFSAVDVKTGSTGPRTGFFQVFEKQQFVVKKWNTSTEDLDDCVLSEEDKERYRQGLMEMDRFLGAYPFDDTLKTWMALTGFITPADVARLQPDNGRIASVPESAPMQTEDALTAASVVESSRPTERAAIKFTSIPRTQAPPSATPAEVTRCSLDRSYTLETLLHGVYHDDWKAVLGELQFAFVCFLVGQGFEQWKTLLHLLCSCDDALVKYPQLYHELMGVLHFQLRETPKDFFVDIVSRDNFLTVSLQSLFSRIQHANLEPGLARRAELFQNWDFDVEPDDEQPVIVETD